jgi:hypothetical protein
LRTVWPKRASAVLSGGASAMTVASCSIVPTFSVRFRATTLRPSTITFSCTIGAKPWAVAVTRYSPAGSGDNTYTPEPLVRRVVSTPVAAFFATTEALGTTAPDGSKIVPVIDPAPPICASAMTGAASRTGARDAQECGVRSHAQPPADDETTPPDRRERVPDVWPGSYRRSSSTSVKTPPVLVSLCGTSESRGSAPSRRLRAPSAALVLQHEPRAAGTLPS